MTPWMAQLKKSLLGSVVGAFYFAEAVSGLYGWPQKGEVIAANELDIRVDIPEKLTFILKKELLLQKRAD